MSYDFLTYFKFGFDADILAQQLTFNISGDNIIIDSPPSNVIEILEAHSASLNRYLYIIKNTGQKTVEFMNFLVDFSPKSLQLFNDFIMIEFYIPFVESALLQKISEFVNPPNFTVVDLKIIEGNNFIQSGNDILQTKQPNEIIVSSLGRGQFTSVSEAVNSISSEVIIKICAGEYYEQNPIILPAGCTICSEGSAGNTKLIALNAGPLIKTKIMNKISNLTLVGGGIEHDGSIAGVVSTIADCIILNAPVAFFAQGPSPVLFTRSFITISQAGTFEGIKAEGGTIIATEIMLKGNALVQIQKGINLTNGSSAVLDACNLEYCQTGVIINNGSVFRTALVEIVNCSIGCQIDTDTGTFPDSQLKIGILNMENVGTSLKFLRKNKNYFLSAMLNDNTIINESSGPVNANIQNYSNNRSYQVLSGKILIGAEKIKSTLSMGCNMNIENFIAYFNDLNVSETLRLPDDPSLEVSGDLYICHNSMVIKALQFDYIALNINSVSAYSGTWNPINYYLKENLLSFDEEFTHQKINLYGLETYWYKINFTNSNIRSIIPFCDTYLINEEGEQFYFGKSRKKKNIYIWANYFLPPEHIDISCPVKIEGQESLTFIKVYLPNLQKYTFDNFSSSYKITYYVS